MTGPPWAVAGKSSDAVTSGGDHMCWTRIQPETAPIGLLIASGIFEGSHRAVPVTPYLGLAALTLKVCGDFFEICGNCLKPFGRSLIGGGGWRRCRTAAMLQFVQFVGQQQ